MKANGRKIAVCFQSPLKRTNKETQTRIIRLSKNETFLLNIPADGYEKVEIPGHDNNLNSYLDIDLEYLESLSTGSDHVSVRRPSPSQLTLPPVDQNLSLSWPDGGISFYDDYVWEDNVSSTGAHFSGSSYETDSEGCRSELEDNDLVEQISPDEAHLDITHPGKVSSSDLKSNEAKFDGPTELSDVNSAGDISVVDCDGSDSGVPSDYSRYNYSLKQLFSIIPISKSYDDAFIIFIS